MNRQAKFDAIQRLYSIGQYSAGFYPTKTSFFKALSEGRVSGNYEERITIISNNPFENYVFVWDPVNGSRT